MHKRLLGLLGRQMLKHLQTEYVIKMIPGRLCGRAAKADGVQVGQVLPGLLHECGGRLKYRSLDGAQLGELSEQFAVTRAIMHDLGWRWRWRGPLKAFEGADGAPPLRRTMDGVAVSD